MLVGLEKLISDNNITDFINYMGWLKIQKLEYFENNITFLKNEKIQNICA